MSKKDKRRSAIKKISLRVKLIIIVIIISLIPILTMGLASYVNAKNEVLDMFQMNSEQNIEHVKENIQKHFIKYETVLDSYLQRDELAKASLGKVNYQGVYDAFDEILPIDESILNIFYGLESGDMLAWPNQPPSDYDPRNSGWYKASLESGGEFTYSEPYADSATGEYVITVAKVAEVNGKVTGAIGIDITLESLTQDLEDIRIGRNAPLHILDSTGTSIVHNDPSFLGTQRALEEPWWNKIQGEQGFFPCSSKADTSYVGYVKDEITHWTILTELDSSEVSVHTNKIRNVIIAILLTILVISMIIIRFISRWIQKHMNTLTEGFRRAESGDLSFRVDIETGDELEDLGNGFNSMMATLKDLVEDVGETSQIMKTTSEATSQSSAGVTQAIEDVSRTVEHIAEGAVKQANDTNDVVRGANALSEEINNVSVASDTIDRLSNEVEEVSKDGLTEIRLLMSKATQSREASNQLSQVINEMDVSTGEIGTIIVAIEEISNQTNLLALNASIEAARAGESGRGFSVVADEIKKLAEQSGESANQIKALIENIREKSELAVESMKITNSSIEEQEDVVNNTESIFNNIMSSIEVLGLEIETIRSIVATTNRMTEDVVSNLSNIATVSEENSAATQEASAATEEINASMTEFNETAIKLKEISEELQEKLSKFTM